MRSKPPSRAILAVLNPVLRVLVPSPLGKLLPGSFAVLRFAGRKSGTPRTVSIFVHDVDGVPTVFTHSPWGRNFDGGAPVTVVRKGRAVAHRGELVTDQAVVAPALLQAVRTKGLRNLGLAAPKGHQPTVEELAAVDEWMIRLQPV